MSASNSKCRVLPSKEAMIGDSQHTEEVKRQISKYAASDQPVLIIGETGTGKELVFRALHEQSNRPGDPEILSCTDLIGDPDKAQMELFGSEKGKFTNVLESHEGVFTRVGQGTVFLDEIGALPAPSQSKLNRVIEYRDFSPIGGKEKHRAECRIIAATNKTQENHYGLNRDLLYRFPHRIRLKPLCERQADIVPLFLHFCDCFCDKHGYTRFSSFEFHIIHQLLVYKWEGNVRELKSCVCDYVDSRVSSEHRYQVKERYLMDFRKTRAVPRGYSGRVDMPFHKYHLVDGSYLFNPEYFSVSWKDHGLEYHPVVWLLRGRLSRNVLKTFQSRVLKESDAYNVTTFDSMVTDLLCKVAKKAETQQQKEAERALDKSIPSKLKSAGTKYWMKQEAVKPRQHRTTIEHEQTQQAHTEEQPGSASEFNASFNDTLEDVKLRFVYEVFRKQGSKSSAATSLGIDRTTVSRMVDRFRKRSEDSATVG